MEILVTFLNHYFDIVFARSDTATFWLAMMYTFLSFTIIYLLFAVTTFYVFRNRSNTKQLNQRPLKNQQLTQEVKGSMISIVVFSLLGGMTFILLDQQWLKVSGDMSVLQWLAEALILYLWNEIHFYSCHRLLHTKYLYRTVHMEHHRSITVTPLATWRFHWFEALLLGSVLPLALLFHDFSVWSLMMLPLISIFWNVIGHSNLKSDLVLLGSAAARHALHHSRFNGNYGFSSRLLDDVFRTSLSE